MRFMSTDPSLKRGGEAYRLRVARAYWGQSPAYTVGDEQKGLELPVA